VICSVRAGIASGREGLGQEKSHHLGLLARLMCRRLGSRVRPIRRILINLSQLYASLAVRGHIDTI
jgi:hypothetical protein